MIDIGKILPEIKWKTSRSSGAGGQHVNKVETRVELIWSIDDSDAFDDEQKSLLKLKLAANTNKKGLFGIACDTHRSQLKNKEVAVRKFERILVVAFKEKKKRKPTKPSKAAVNERIKAKEKRGEIKKSRSVLRIGRE
jgi:ribosome-associated protein